jgi:hypothetical protein
MLFGQQVVNLEVVVMICSAGVRLHRLATWHRLFPEDVKPEDVKGEPYVSQDRGLLYAHAGRYPR